MSLENVQTPEMTQQQRDALAERIAAVLRERKKIGAKQRMQLRRISERALASHRTLAEIHQQPPRLHGSPEYRMQEIHSRFEAIISSNAAFEALKQPPTSTQIWRLTWNSPTSVCLAVRRTRD